MAAYPKEMCQAFWASHRRLLPQYLIILKKGEFSSDFIPLSRSRAPSERTFGPTYFTCMFFGYTGRCLMAPAGERTRNFRMLTTWPSQPVTIYYIKICLCIIKLYYLLIHPLIHQCTAESSWSSDSKFMWGSDPLGKSAIRRDFLEFLIFQFLGGKILI